ncbi:large subunit of alpha-aminoadipate reductase [Metarhizium acridum]|nr:large subunit of alpha-aminoadipate reductase [Metarhizium acridum]
MEAADMMGSRVGLETGYGQTNWVSEQLVREARRRGLLGSVVRPGYILGTPPLLSSRPRIVNTVNAVPLGHVARVVVAACFNPVSARTGTNGGDVGVHVVHVTAHPR